MQLTPKVTLKAGPPTKTLAYRLTLRARVDCLVPVRLDGRAALKGRQRSATHPEGARAARGRSRPGLHKLAGDRDSGGQRRGRRLRHVR